MMCKKVLSDLCWVCMRKRRAEQKIKKKTLKEKQSLKKLILFLLSDVFKDNYINSWFLHILIYFIDSSYFNLNGKLLSGSNYVKSCNVPVCLDLVEVIRNLVCEGVVVESRFDWSLALYKINPVCGVRVRYSPFVSSFVREVAVRLHGTDYVDIVNLCIIDDILRIHDNNELIVFNK